MYYFHFLRLIKSQCSETLRAKHLKREHLHLKGTEGHSAGGRGSLAIAETLCTLTSWHYLSAEPDPQRCLLRYQMGVVANCLVPFSDSAHIGILGQEASDSALCSAVQKKVNLFVLGRGEKSPPLRSKIAAVKLFV